MSSPLGGVMSSLGHRWSSSLSSTLLQLEEHIEGDSHPSGFILGHSSHCNARECAADTLAAGPHARQCVCVH